MKSLTKKEIQEELIRLGIQRTSDIRSYVRDYESYCSALEEDGRSACESTIEDITDLKG